MTAAGYRPDFLAALDLLARASALMVAEGAPPPILVGGAVVEFDTLSAITSGDLDLVCPAVEALDRALLAVGFHREDRAGRRLGGWYHADLPIAVDCVSARYFDGLGDRARLRVVAQPSGEVLMAPIEEMIIDRYGQWEASGRRDAALREQIRALVLLAETLDATYIRQRITMETGDPPDVAALGISLERDGPTP